MITHRLLVFVLLMGQGATLAAQQLTQRLDSLVERHYSPDKPGVALRIEQHGRVLYQRTLGLANTHTQQPISPQTTFRMASVTKQFTAMCIAILEQEGKLSFEDPLLKFFPQFAPKVGHQVRLKHLLTHSSGLLDYENLIRPTQTQQVSDADVLRLVAPLDSTYFEPGTQFRYSNTGFCVLALVVEQVAKESFGEFVRKRLLEPARMSQSFVYEASTAPSHRGMGYSGSFEAADQSITSATKGDGCLYTSLLDYSRWHQALGRRYWPALDKLLGKVYQPIVADKRYYGMGWFFAYQPDGALEMSHTGGTCGFTNLVVRLPKHDFLLVCFTNIADNGKFFAELSQVLATVPSLPQCSLWDVEQLTR